MTEGPDSDEETEWRVGKCEGTGAAEVVASERRYSHPSDSRRSPLS